MTRAQQMRLFGWWCKLNVVGGFARPGQLAMRQFLTPPKARFTPKQEAFLASARRSTLPFEGHTLAVYEWGPEDAPYLYTAYGYGYNAGRWRHFAPAFVEAGYRVIAYDYVGHGNSSRDLVDYPLIVRTQEFILRTFGRPEFALLHSFGAGTFIEVAAQLPEALWPTRIALLAPFSDAYYIFRQYADALGFGESLFNSLTQAIQARTGRDVYSFDLAAAATRLGDLPALIVHDPADPVTNYSNARRIHAHWPGSHLLPAPNAGHGIASSEATAAIQGWLMHADLPAHAIRSSATEHLAEQLEHPLERWFRPVAQVSAYADGDGTYYRQ